MAVCDASVMTSVFIPGDKHHNRSLLWYTQAISDGVTLHAPNLLLVEVAAAIRRETGNGELVERAIEQMRADYKLYELTDARAQASARVADTCSVRGADAVYLALAQELGQPLITMDRQQLDRGSQVATTREP